jgi:hypothetical protein
MEPEHRASLRILLGSVFATAARHENVNAIHREVDELNERAAIARDRIIDSSQQETARLSTAQPSRPHSSWCGCELCSAYDTERARELAPRSGALEPEETTDGTGRSDT